MSDLQKVVAVRVQKSSTDTAQNPTLQPQGPLFGNIVNEADSEVGPTHTRTVLWSPWLVQDVVASSVTDLNLDVIEDADPATVSEFEGQMVLRIAPGGPVAGDPAGGTSREFAGLVCGIYKRTPIEATPGSGVDFLLVFVNGAYFEGEADTFTVLTNR